MGDGERDRFRRPARKIVVRRRAALKRLLWGMGRALLVVAVAALLAGGGWLLHRYARQGRMFRVESAASIEIVNARHVSQEAIRERFAEDIGRSVFWIPLAERRRAIEEIPWVEAASVQRFLPNRLRVAVAERTPVAYVRQGSFLWLVDAEGMLLPVPEGAGYDFPVLTGLPESLSQEERRKRVRLYRELIADLDAGGKAHSAQLSEVDLSDAEDVRAVVTDTTGTIRLHFGRGRYGEKFETFLEHRHVWQESRQPVRSVDLRYRGQIVLNPGVAVAERKGN